MLKTIKKAPERQSFSGVNSILPQRGKGILPTGVIVACPRGANSHGVSILPLFAFLRETKNPDFVWKSGFYCLLLFFKVVPPGIEPGTQGFSVLCSTN